MHRRLNPQIVRLFIVLFALIFLSFGCSKDEDEGTTTDGTSWDLIDTYIMEIPGAVWPLSSGTVLVGADYETVYHSTNSGRGWSNTVLDNTKDRMALDLFFTDTRGIMIGERGMLYTTTDNGLTWTDAAPARVADDEIDLKDIIYPATGETNPLFIVGQNGTLLESSDGGASWFDVELDILVAESTMVINDSTGDTTWDYTPVYLNQEIVNFTGGFAPNASIIYTVGDTLTIDDEFYLYYSKNSGTDWNILTIPLEGAFTECYFSDDTSGMLFGADGGIWKLWTTNDSIRYSNVAILGSGKNITEVEFTTPEIGWVIGTGGLVAKTTNGGTNWTSMDVDVTGAISDIGFLDTDEGWIVGNDASRGTGAIKYTSDGGANWFFKSYGLGLALYSVHFISNTEGWIAGKAGRIAHTTDSGRMWIHQDANMDKTFQDIFFLDANHGWAVGFSTNNYLDTTMTILRTTDGGEEWISLTDLEGQRLNSIIFTDANNGWAVGNYGLIIHSIDGGLTWTTQDAGTQTELFDLNVIDNQTAFAVGQAGTILKTTNAGTNWTLLQSDTEQSLTGIDMLNSNTGYACGSMGTILKTTNSGSSWEILDLPSYSGTIFKSVAFINTEVGWAVGKFGYILHTADGGETWYRQEAGFSEDALNDIFILDSQHAWIAGDASILMELRQ